MGGLNKDVMETITLESYPSSKCHHFWPPASSWYWYIWCYSLPLAGRQLQKLPFDQPHRDVTGLKAVVYVPTVNLNQLYQFQYGLDPLRVFKDPVASVILLFYLSKIRMIVSVPENKCQLWSCARVYQKIFHTELNKTKQDRKRSELAVRTY